MYFFTQEQKDVNNACFLFNYWQTEANVATMIMDLLSSGNKIVFSWIVVIASFLQHSPVIHFHSPSTTNYHPWNAANNLLSLSCFPLLYSQLIVHQFTNLTPHATSSPLHSFHLPPAQRLSTWFIFFSNRLIPLSTCFIKQLTSLRILGMCTWHQG